MMEYLSKFNNTLNYVKKKRYVHCRTKTCYMVLHKVVLLEDQGKRKKKTLEAGCNVVKNMRWL